MTALVKVVSPGAVPGLAAAQQQQMIETANSQVTQLRAYLTTTGNL